MTNSIFSSQLKFLKRVMELNTGDITQEESLVSSPQSGNSVNWLIGHMIVVRDLMLDAMGLECMASEEMVATYSQGTKNVDKESAMQFTELLKMYYQGTEEMLKRLEGDELNDEEKVKSIAGLIFHECYHSGQIGLFRRIIGKEPKIK